MISSHSWLRQRIADYTPVAHTPIKNDSGKVRGTDHGQLSAWIIQLYSVSEQKPITEIIALCDSHFEMMQRSTSH